MPRKDDAPLPAVVVRVAGVLLFALGLATSWIFYTQWWSPSGGGAGAAFRHPVIGCFLALVIVIAIVQGAQMTLASDPSAITLPRYLVGLGAVLCVGAAVLQVTVGVRTRDMNSLGTAVFSVALSIAVIKLARDRFRKHREKSDDV